MKPWTVIDLFSGAGGMSYGFHARAEFHIRGAVDAQVGKPSSGHGSLECNDSYEANIGVRPVAADLTCVDPAELARAFAITSGDPLTVLLACPPCTGFSRAVNKNHSADDVRNSLVGRSVCMVRQFKPAIFVMENARELIRGNFSHHYASLAQQLELLGYRVHGSVHTLTEFGLPQRRERSLVVAVRRGLEMRTLGDLWQDYEVRPPATFVSRALAGMSAVKAGEGNESDPLHVSPRLGAVNANRLRCIPKDGGSWADLRHHPERESLLTPAMLRSLARNDLGSHPDVYGRMAWHKPAPTIKRECGHIGNGRYGHPEEDRLCTIRELAILQGFPKGYQLVSKCATNKYRHLGDAVPPLISYQLSAICKWILTGDRPGMDEVILPGSHLTSADIVPRACTGRGLFD